MSSVILSSGTGAAIFAELFEINSKAVECGEQDKRNSCCKSNANCNQSVQSNLQTGFKPGAERAYHV